MRLHVAFAVIAITCSSGWAAGVGMLAPSEALPSVQVLSLEEEPLAVMQAVGLPGAVALPASGVGAPSLDGDAVERVDRLPRHLLLPDGALTLSLQPSPTDLLANGVLVHGAAPVLPAAPVEAPVLPILPRLEPAPLAAAPVVEASPAPAAPAATDASTQATEPARVFEPPQPAGGAGPVVLWVGGLAALVGLTTVGVVLYHRIRPNAALENETRKNIFDAVCAQPGLGVHEISKLAGVSYSTATYHLERLIGAGMLVMTPDGNKLCYYKNGGAFTESERKILPLLKNDEAAKLFECILQAPGTYRAALAEQLGVTATTINWHLRRLREAGLVDETRAGRSAHLYARIDVVRPTLVALAQKVEPSEPLVAERLRRFAAAPAPAGTTGVAGA